MGVRTTVQANYEFIIQSSTKISVADEAQAALQYALAKLRVPAAHKRATGKTVKVAVIDTAGRYRPSRTERRHA